MEASRFIEVFGLAGEGLPPFFQIASGETDRTGIVRQSLTI